MLVKKVSSIVLTLMLFFVIAAESISVDPSSEAKVPKGASLKVKVNVNGNNNTTYKVRIEASDGVNTFVLDSGNSVSTDGAGKGILIYSEDPTKLAQGEKYTFTAKLYDEKAKIPGATPLATGTKDHTIAK